MSYKALLGVLVALPFLVLFILYTTGSLEAAGQGQNSQRNSPPEFGSTRITRSVTENVAAGAVGAPITATDDDSDTLTYSIQTAPRGPFDIDSSTGQLRTTEPLNYEAMSTFQTPSYMLTSYRFVVRVRDAKYAYDEITVEINVVDVEEPGVVDLLWDQPQVGTPIVASLTDPDGEVADLTWQWTRSTSGTGDWTDVTTNGTSATYTPVAADENNYLRATASYTDRRGSDKTAHAVSVNATRADPGESNGAPTFSADDYPDGTDTRRIAENSPSGTHIGAVFRANDTDTDDIRYFLGGTDGGSFDIDPKSGQLKVKDPLNHESKETYSLKVFGRDPTRAGGTLPTTGTVTVTVTVRDVNERPKVSGDFKPTYAENSGSLLVTTLTGFDEDEDGPFKQNYYMGWLISGYGGSDGDFFYLDDSRDEVDIKFRVPPDFDNPADRNRDNVYDISMTAYSGRNDSTYFHVNVTVSDGNDEGVVEGPPSVNYPEGATRAVATYTISDTSQQTLAWSVTGTDGDKFTIKDGELNFKTSPDYNSPADYSRNNVYSVWVAASGDGVTAWKKVAVTVIEHNDPPVISGPTAPTFAENATETVAQYTATDADQDPITWSAGGTDGSYFDISSAGVLTFKSPPDFEARADNNYEVTVQAYDGTDTTDYPVTVTVTNVNEAPVFADATATRSIAENTAAGVNIGDAITATDQDAGDKLTYSLDQSSAAVFDIDSNGQLKTKADLDHETTPSYAVTVVAKDRLGATGSIAVTISVSDVNEAPAFPPTEDGARSIPEDTPANENIGDPVEADDPDAGATLTYTLGGTDVASFDFDTSTGQIKTKDALDLEVKSSYTVTVSVRDSKDDAGTTDTADDATIDVTITVTNVNDAPAFDPGTATRDVPENTPADQDIGEPVEATDRDSGDTLTYSLDATSAELFAIDSSGQLKTKAPLDYETKDSYSVTVKATDSAQASDEVPVIITVKDMNEAPTFDGENATRDVAENAVAGVNIGGPVMATDQDTGDTLTYSIDQASVAFFDIDGTSGQLKTKAPLDYETKSTYTVTVSVRDSKAADGTADTAQDASITVTVNVTDLAEDGTITLSSRQPQVETDFTATLSDPNVVSPVVTWAWEKSTDKTLWTTISTATNEVYTPMTGDVDSYLKVTAIYNDGQGSDDKSAQAVSGFAVRAAPTGSNNTPVFSVKPDTRQVYDNVTVGSNVGSPVTATDADSDDLNKLTYTLSGADAESFVIDAGSGQIRTAIALDYDTEDSYEVIVTAKDPSLATDTVSVTVAVIKYVPPRRPGGGGGGSNSNRPTNSKPAFDQSGTVQLSVPENTEPEVVIGDPITATDANDAQLAYAIQAGSDGASFDIDSSSGQLKTKANLDYEVKATYSLSVSVTDGKDANGNPDTAADDTVTVTITVTDVNEPPAFASETTREVVENTPSGRAIGDAFTATDQDQGDALTYTLDATSAAVFDIDSNGQLRTKGSLDYDTTPSYTVTISVRDSRADDGTADTVDDDSIAVTITVIDSEEAGTVTLSPRQPQVGTAFAATLVDPEIPSPSMAWAWERSTDKSAWTAITGAKAATYTPVTSDLNNYLRATVIYNDGQGGNSKAARAVSEFAVRAAPTGSNTAPAFATDPDTRSIVEGADLNRNVGAPVTATDDDSYDANLLTYTLDGLDAESFSIVESSGQIKTKIALVHADQATYTVTVTATDPSLASDTITVTINVTQVVVPRQTRSSGGGGGGSRAAKPANPEPEFDARGPVNISVPENTEAGTDIGDPLTASDDDDTALTYSIVDWKDGSSFDIDSSTGQLKTKVPLDYETRTQYQFQAKVHDDEGGDDGITVNIRVTGVPEAPVITGDTTIQVAENSAGRLATYSATDPEGLDVTWGLSGEDAGDFSIANGALIFASTPDHENPDDDDGDNIYEVTIEASDGTDTGRLDVTVTVTNLIDDFRVEGFARGSATKTNGALIVMTSLSYPENSTATVATYSAIESSGNEIEWSTAGDDGSLFSIEIGALRFKSPPDYEAPADSGQDNDYTVNVQASDGTETASLDISISVTNVNEGPTVTGDAAVDYAEQDTGSVGSYTGNDPEGDDLEWSLSGDDAAAFTIEGGVLSFAPAPNFETPSDSGSNNVYEVMVEVSDGTYTDTLGVSVTVTDMQEVPITNPATQAVGKVYPESETTIETPDDVAAATFPVNSRATLYMVLVDSDLTNCSVDTSGVSGSPDPNDYNLRVCLSVDIFDTWGNQEQDVTLDSAASISLTMDADDLGGADVVRQAYEDGGISTYTRSGSDDPWSVVEFTLSIDDEGIVTITVTGITSFSSFAASTDDAVFEEVINPTPESTPAPTPAPTSTPRPESRERSGPTSMVSGSGVLRIPAQPGSAAMSVQAAPSAPDDTSQEGQPATPEASAGTILVEVVNSPLWALILMIIGSLMAIAGAGLIAKPYFPRPRYIK